MAYCCRVVVLKYAGSVPLSSLDRVSTQSKRWPSLKVFWHKTKFLSVIIGFFLLLGVSLARVITGLPPRCTKPRPLMSFVSPSLPTCIGWERREATPARRGTQILGVSGFRPGHLFSGGPLRCHGLSLRHISGSLKKKKKAFVHSGNTRLLDLFDVYNYSFYLYLFIYLFIYLSITVSTSLAQPDTNPLHLNVLRRGPVVIHLVQPVCWVVWKSSASDCCKQCVNNM